MKYFPFTIIFIEKVDLQENCCLSKLTWRCVIFFSSLNSNCLENYRQYALLVKEATLEPESLIQKLTPPLMKCV